MNWPLSRLHPLITSIHPYGTPEKSGSIVCSLPSSRCETLKLFEDAHSVPSGLDDISLRQHTLGKRLKGKIFSPVIMSIKKTKNKGEKRTKWNTPPHLNGVLSFIRLAGRDVESDLHEGDFRVVILVKLQSDFVLPSGALGDIGQWDLEGRVVIDVER